jgi:hypothetical protein
MCQGFEARLCPELFLELRKCVHRLIRLLLVAFYHSAFAFKPSFVIHPEAKIMANGLASEVKRRV